MRRHSSTTLPPHHPPPRRGALGPAFLLSGPLLSSAGRPVWVSRAPSPADPGLLPIVHSPFYLTFEAQGEPGRALPTPHPSFILASRPPRQSLFLFAFSCVFRIWQILCFLVFPPCWPAKPVPIINRWKFPIPKMPSRKWQITPQDGDPRVANLCPHRHCNRLIMSTCPMWFPSSFALIGQANSHTLIIAPRMLW